MGNFPLLRESEIAGFHLIFSDNHRNRNPASKNRTFHPYWCTFKQQISWQSRIVEQEPSGYSRNGYCHHFQLQYELGRNTVFWSLCSWLCCVRLRNDRTLTIWTNFCFLSSHYNRFFFPSNSPPLSCSLFASFNIFFHFWIGLAVNEKNN